jgi:sulfide dehydrogenase [flavocytochrome c] flavoprotein subunit
VSTISRRGFIKLMGVTGAASSLGLVGMGGVAHAHTGGHVVVIGGGYGGATAAKYIKKFDSSIAVTLIEPKKVYASCPASNWVISGMKPMKFIQLTYGTLAKKYDIKVVHDMATAIDADARKVKLKGGEWISYDRSIVSPGIGFRWDTIEGYEATVTEKIPHAWNAGQQTELLRSQLEAMEDGGTVIIAAPPNPFRCPPGPYERASLIAYYFKMNKPKSKILILDAKQKFSKQGLFTAGWEKLYGYGTDKSLIEWVPGPEGKVISVDAENRTVTAGELEDVYKGDVINVIPAQKAGHIAEVSGLTDESGWCPVDPKTWESKNVPNVHVIGDAAIQSPLPKSGYAANSEAKVCAAAVVDLITDHEPGVPSWVNTCYSLVGPQYGISVAMVYELTSEGKVGKVKGSGGLSPKDGNRILEALYAQNWYNNIIDDTFG